jgi:transcriptional regulator CtsR
VRISDLIARYIEQQLEREQGCVQLSRSELAEHFNCVPSQINYVIMTRFSPEHGYYVDSRRGGGGYIKITRVKMNGNLLLMHVINTIGDKIDAMSSAAYISNLREDGVISDEAAALLSAAVSDKALSAADKGLRDTLRASVLKRCLLILT